MLQKIVFFPKYSNEEKYLSEKLSFFSNNNNIKKSKIIEKITCNPATTNNL